VLSPGAGGILSEVSTGLAWTRSFACSKPTRIRAVPLTHRPCNRAMRRRNCHYPAMKFPAAFLVICLASLAVGCSESTEDKLKSSMEEVENKLEDKLEEGKVEAKRLLAAARERWEEMRPEAERALASLEERVEKLVHDAEALKRLPPETLERVRARLDALRAKLAQANSDHEQGHTDLAVEKADDVQRETAQVEELLVERPDPR
jgi:hypothetical protein